MFTYWAIKKYVNKLLPMLASRYGCKKFYTACEVRTTIFQCNYNTKFLPLAYMLALNKVELEKVMTEEFPDVNINEYKSKMIEYLNSKKYKGQMNGIFLKLA